MEENAEVVKMSSWSASQNVFTQLVGEPAKFGRNCRAGQVKSAIADRRVFADVPFHSIEEHVEMSSKSAS